MTDTDEHLLTIAKLREVVDGDLENPAQVKPHAGFVRDDRRRASLNFVDTLVQDSDDFDATSFADTQLGSELYPNFATNAASEAVARGDSSLASYLVGITETEYDGSALTVTLDLVDALHFDGAPSFWSVAGNPNTGKTNSMFKLVDVADRAGNVIEQVPNDFLVLSNAESWERADIVVKSMHDLMVALLEYREQPKIVAIDEGSTHFDARTYNYEVSHQWTPAAKRFAKVGVYAVGIICHTGKDLHPEAKRLTTTALWKETKTDMMIYNEWPGDADQPTDPMFADPVQDFEKAVGYDPDDAAPWSWNLRAELFSKGSDWKNLLTILKEQGPEET
ncbi:hypothetical protein ACLI4Z_18055 [Natrialbaceae archaeon A-arb3/5]